MRATMTQDDSVLDEVRRRLADSSHLLLRSVNCRLRDGRLQLTGRVPSFYLKQLAQAVVQNVEGVRLIENELRVVNPRGTSSTQHVAP